MTDSPSSVLCMSHFRPLHLLLHPAVWRPEVVAGPDLNQPDRAGPGDHQPRLPRHRGQCVPHTAPARGPGSLQTLQAAVQQLQHLPGVLLPAGAGGVCLHQRRQADGGTSHYLRGDSDPSQRLEGVIIHLMT